MAELIPPFASGKALFVAALLRPGLSSKDVDALVDETEAASELRRLPNKGVIRRRRQDTVVFRAPDGQAPKGLNFLRGDDRRVLAAGPAELTRDRRWRVLLPLTVVEFAPGTTAVELGRIVREVPVAGFRLGGSLPTAPCLFWCGADPTVGLDILRAAAHLRAHRSVRWAQSVTAAHPTALGDLLADPTHGWDRVRINVEAAQLALAAAGLPRYGDPDRVLAVIDNGLASTAGVVQHPDFAGKVIALYDARTGAPDNDVADINDHGLAVAGLAAANRQVSGPWADFGVEGVAPAVRLISAIPPTATLDIDATFLWAAEVAGVPPPGHPSPPPDPADVIVCSQDLTHDAPLDGSTVAMLRVLAMRGRGGKGCLTFFAGGNNGVTGDPPKPLGATTPFAFACGASDVVGGQDQIASYSSYGAPGAIEWVAPAAKEGDQYATFTASFHCYAEFETGPWPARNVYTSTSLDVATPLADGVSIPVDPNLLPHLVLFTTVVVADTWGYLLTGIDPVGSTLQLFGSPYAAHPTGTALTFSARRVTALSSPVSQGDTELHVSDPGAFPTPGPPDRLFMLDTRHPYGPPPKPERIEIINVVTSGPDAGLVTLARPVEEAHPTGAPVYVSVASCASGFGGTSAAAPLCAGTAALVLSAAPHLSWIEVRNLMRETAVVPPAITVLPDAKWGYGRIDAAAAVGAALAYGEPRDLFVRNAIADDGTAPSPIADSPDIWVTRTPGGPPSRAGIEHGDPARVFVRVHNRGPEPAFEAYVRVYVAARRPGPFNWPEDWRYAGLNGIGNLDAQRWQRGTYFIGEASLATGAVPGAGAAVVSVDWPPALQPPPAALDGADFDPVLLVEVLPFDGQLTDGTTVEDNAHLAQRAVPIAGAPAGRPWVDLRTPTGDPLPTRIAAPTDGSPAGLALRARVLDAEGI
ncbi:MAG: S8 family serine peptidase, partial [Myxococcales bacterium]|nr:S8 family serine peptidase [Myxococcales bacterium]